MKLDVELSAMDPTEKYSARALDGVNAVVGRGMAVGLMCGLLFAKAQFQGWYFVCGVLGIMTFGTVTGWLTLLAKTPADLRAPGAWSPK